MPGLDIGELIKATRLGGERATGRRGRRGRPLAGSKVGVARLQPLKVEIALAWGSRSTESPITSHRIAPHRTTLYWSAALQVHARLQLC